MDMIPSLPAATSTHPLFRDKGRVFPATAKAVPVCRRIIRADLFIHGLADLSDDVCSVAAELTANAVDAMQAERREGRLDRLPMMMLSLEWMSAGVRIGIWDDSPDVPEVRASAGDDEHGRGLSIVNAVTGGRWGWFAAGPGKCVWGEIVRPAASPSAVA